MELAQDRVQWQALVLAVLNLQVLLPGAWFTLVIIVIIILYINLVHGLRMDDSSSG